MYQRRQHGLAMRRISVAGVPSAALPPTVDSRLRRQPSSRAAAAGWRCESDLPGPYWPDGRSGDKEAVLTPFETGYVDLMKARAALKSTAPSGPPRGDTMPMYGSPSAAE